LRAQYDTLSSFFLFQTSNRVPQTISVKKDTGETLCKYDLSCL
jgi:hypothetical protein